MAKIYREVPRELVIEELETEIEQHRVHQDRMPNDAFNRGMIHGLIEALHLLTGNKITHDLAVKLGMITYDTAGVGHFALSGRSQCQEPNVSNPPSREWSQEFQDKWDAITEEKHDVTNAASFTCSPSYLTPLGYIELCSRVSEHLYRNSSSNFPLKSGDTQHLHRLIKDLNEKGWTAIPIEIGSYLNIVEAK